MPRLCRQQPGRGPDVPGVRTADLVVGLGGCVLRHGGAGHRLVHRLVAARVRHSAAAPAHLAQGARLHRAKPRPHRAAGQGNWVVFGGRMYKRLKVSVSGWSPLGGF